MIRTKGDARFLAAFTAMGIILTFMLTAASTGYYAWRSAGGRAFFPDWPFAGFPHPKPTWEVLGRNYLSVLIIGSDAHLKYDAGRSDTLIWAFLDFRKETVDVVSIPRDLLVRIPSKRGGYFDKICHAYGLGGPELTQKAVENFLGITIDQVVSVDYEGFIKVIDTLGGVEIDVEKQMDYDDYAGGLHIHIKKGRQVLDGLHALEYVRFRHDPRGDFARIERQQKFIAALKDKGLRLSQIGKIDDMARIINESIYLTPAQDPNDVLGNREIIALLGFFTKLDNGNIRFHSVPVKAEIMYNKLSSLVPDYSELDKIMQMILEDGVPESSTGNMTEPMPETKAEGIDN